MLFPTSYARVTTCFTSWNFDLLHVLLLVIWILDIQSNTGNQTHSDTICWEINLLCVYVWIKSNDFRVITRIEINSMKHDYKALMQMLLLETGYFMGLHFHRTAQVKKHQTKVINQLAMKIMKRMKMNLINGFILELESNLLYAFAKFVDLCN